MGSHCAANPGLVFLVSRKSPLSSWDHGTFHCTQLLFTLPWSHIEVLALPWRLLLSLPSQLPLSSCPTNSPSVLSPNSIHGQVLWHHGTQGPQTMNNRRCCLGTVQKCRTADTVQTYCPIICIWIQSPRVRVHINHSCASKAVTESMHEIKENFLEKEYRPLRLH